tara:strand:+ start:173 stop:1192 length:1020 start_codon:yes stop_codon:yes gene_type:complete
MSERGTEISAFDFAKYNEILLGNESIIIADRKKIFNKFEKFFIDKLSRIKLIKKNNFKIFPKRQRSTFSKFAENFNIFFYDDPSEIDLICKDNRVDFLYAQKYGNIDKVYSNYCKNLVHAIFMTNEIHGDKYLYVSEWLAKAMTGNKNNCVPLIVDNNHLSIQKNLKNEFNIDDNKTVISSYGGKRVFDVPFVKEVIKDVLDIRKDIIFMFLNIESFLSHPRVHFLPRSIDKIFKAKFVNTSDYMIHARTRGETFGLAVAEFSIRNKPVISYSGSPEKAHLDVLGDKCFKYSNSEELYNLLINLNKDSLVTSTGYYDCYSKKFNPKTVMKIFEERFLEM